MTLFENTNCLRAADAEIDVTNIQYFYIMYNLLHKATQVFSRLG